MLLTATLRTVLSGDSLIRGLTASIKLNELEFCHLLDELERMNLSDRSRVTEWLPSTNWLYTQHAEQSAEEDLSWRPWERCSAEMLPQRSFTATAIKKRRCKREMYVILQRVNQQRSLLQEQQRVYYRLGRLRDYSL